MRRSTKTVLCAAAVALVAAASASAHPRVSPPVTLAKQGEIFTLAVPTEKANATTTSIELTPPAGFTIDSFVPAPGWKRSVQQSGSGESAEVTKVTWTGGKVPSGEDAAFSFLASTDAAKKYTFEVRQTYSDGSVVDWSGPESSDTPAPTIEAKDSFGGGGTSTLEIVALVVAVIALVVAIVAVLSGSGKRALA
jgi:uncharacterized protein YcnI